jgi:hypothetical protein
VATRYPSCLFCHQSRMLIQSTPPISSLHCYRGIRLCDSRNVSISKHIWVGLLGPVARTRMELVHFLSTLRDYDLVHLGVPHEKTSDGVGNLCSSISICCHFPNFALSGAHHQTRNHGMRPRSLLQRLHAGRSDRCASYLTYCKLPLACLSQMMPGRQQG